MAPTYLFPVYEELFAENLSFVFSHAQEEERWPHLGPAGNRQVLLQQIESECTVRGQKSRKKNPSTSLAATKQHFYPLLYSNGRFRCTTAICLDTAPRDSDARLFCSTRSCDGGFTLLMAYTQIVHATKAIRDRGGSKNIKPIRFPQAYRPPTITTTTRRRRRVRPR